MISVDCQWDIRTNLRCRQIILLVFHEVGRHCLHRSLLCRPADVPEQFQFLLYEIEYCHRGKHRLTTEEVIEGRMEGRKLLVDQGCWTG